MRFDLSNGINALEYEVMNHDDAVARVVEAFKLYWSHTEVRQPQYILQRITQDLGINLNFLSSCERKQIENEINDFLNS